MTDHAVPPDLDTRRLLRLLEVSAHLNAAEDTDQLLSFIIRTAADLLSCAGASVLLYDEQAERLRFAAATGADPEVLATIPVPLDGSIAGAIFRENRIVRIDHAPTDERHFDGVDEKTTLETRSLLGVPMRIGDRVVGVIEAINKDDDGVFSDEDELMLLVLSDHAAVAIRAARQVEALRNAHDRLARTEAMKQRFLTLASHELRTPLAVVKGFAELLRDEAGDAGAEPTGVILDEVRTMEAVLDAMGEMNALRVGTDSGSLSPTPIDALVRAACSEIAHAVAAKRHTLRLDLDLDLGREPLAICADAPRVTTALVNLLDNAVRFTPEGGQITLRAEHRDGGVLVEVADTGCGLDEPHLHAVFDDFFQVEDALTRTHGGLGLGLTIARGIAEVHGGRLWAESDGHGHGATFSLWMPTIAHGVCARGMALAA